MAFKLALISFKFDSVAGLSYLPDHDQKLGDSSSAESCQPVVREAFELIRHCIADSVASNFRFGLNKLENINNYLHIGRSVIGAEVSFDDESRSARTNTIILAKFYRLAPKKTYKVTLDIEHMPASFGEPRRAQDFEDGFTNKQIEKLVELLDDRFNLGNQIEYMPLIKRGRLSIPHYLISSDERLMEYDFNKLLFHKRSQFQDVKILASPSLGNTLLLDNLQNLAEADLPYTYCLMDRGNVSYKGKEILILGGGDGGLLWELLKEEPKFVTMAEIDPVVIEACRDHLKPCGKALENLNGPNYQVIVDDCIKLLRKSVEEGKKYDFVFNDLTDIPVSSHEDALNAFEPSVRQKDNPWHFIETIFNLSLECLKPDGLYMNHATGRGSLGSLRAYEEFLSRSRLPVEFEKRSEYVPSFMEFWIFYTIRLKQLR